MSEPTSENPRRPIVVLSADLASQIAAGEVVERPASVVKELIENALDANATRVTIKIEAGGIGLIEVADDGTGMHGEDASLSLSRHATSKLRRFEDLDDLGSYGFRGEALPAIASVSRLHIITRHVSAESGLSIVVEGTTEARPVPHGHPVGTTIAVRDLFFNVPARRKFLRSSNTESGHVVEVINDAALTRPDVSFSLIRDGKQVRHYERVRSLHERAQQVMEESDLVPIAGQRGPVSVDAYLAPLERARRGAQGLKLIVNGRPVRDRALAATVAHACGPQLERGRYPRGVIYLDLPRRLVDVNVHPQKTEVRFVDARAVCDALYSVVAKVLSTRPSRSSETATPSLPATSSFSQQQATTHAPLGEPDPTRARSKIEASSQSAVELRHEQAPVSGQRYAAQPGTKLSQSRVEPGRAETIRGKSAWLEDAAQHVQGVMRTAERPQRALRLLGQAQDAFLVCASSDGICILDQHAADELGIFQRLTQAYRTGGLQSQAVLFPSTLSLNKRDTELVAKRVALLLRLGLDVRVRSEGTVSLHAMMGLLKRADAEATVRAFLVAARTARDETTLVEQFFSQLACLEAVPRGVSLSLGDAQAILKGLASTDIDQANLPCVHGRPLLSATSFTELARKAER